MFLLAAVDVEELGRRQDPRPDDGLGRGHLLRSGEEAEKEAFTRLSSRQP